MKLLDNDGLMIAIVVLLMIPAILAGIILLAKVVLSL